MFHVCIFTDSKNTKFIVAGGFNETEIHAQLSKILGDKFSVTPYNKLVLFKSFLMDEEGQNYSNHISKFEQKDLAKLVISENSTFSDQTKHLVNQ
jgi:hypothetical protein